MKNWRDHQYFTMGADAIIIGVMGVDAMDAGLGMGTDVTVIAADFNLALGDESVDEIIAVWISNSLPYLHSSRM